MPSSQLILWSKLVMAEFLNEQFDGTDGQSLTAYNPAWARLPTANGTISLLAGTARHASGSTTSSYYRSDAVPPGPDYSVSADLTITASVGTASMAVVLRASNTANTLYYARLGASALTLLKVSAGTAATLSSSPITTTVGSTYRLRGEIIGNQFSAYLDGVLVVTATDNAITAPGFVGLRSINGNSVIAVDNLVASTPDGNTGVDTTFSPDSNALVLQAFSPSVVQTRNQTVFPTAGELSIEGFAPLLTLESPQAPDTVTISLPSPSPMVTLRGYAPAVVRTARTTVMPARISLAFTGYTPSISQFFGVTPEYSISTIMRATTTNRTAAMGPADTNRTVSFP